MKGVYAALVVTMLCPLLAMAQPAAPAAAKPAAAPAVAGPLDVPMFPLDSLTAGMKGTGYTVIRGTEIKQFNVEILELIPKGGYDGGPLILARFTGEAVDFSNGIAGGYSGSPVYIDGKLLGAVSMAMPFTDTHIGGITPIQSMIQALPSKDEVDYSKNTVLPTSTNNGKPLDAEGNPIAYMRDPEAARRFNDSMEKRGLHRYAAVPAATPVFFSGISPQVIKQFSDKMSATLGTNFQVIDAPVGNADGKGLFLRRQVTTPGLLLQKKSEQPPLVRGDAIAVSLIQGDIEAYAIGTLTYSDKQGRFLCFGHPLMQSGDANFPIGKAYVTWTFKSLERAFKEGLRLNNVGTLTKDHAAACGGMLGQEPDMIPVKIKISDVDLGTSETLKFSVIRHPDFTPTLIAMGMSQATLQVLDRQPKGTLKLSYHIEGAGLKEPLRRTNFFSDDMDVVANSAIELAPLSSLLETNIYREVHVTKVEILLEITRNRINASIDDAKIIPETPAATPEGAAAPASAAPPIATESAAKPEQQAPDSDSGDLEDNETLTNIFKSGTAAADSQKRLQTPPPPEPEPQPEPQPQPQPQPENPAQPKTDAAPGGLTLATSTPANLPTYKPGDTIRVKVRLQPFRTDAVWREFSIKVPADFPAGNTMVVVHGGGDLISPSELNGKGRTLMGLGPVLDLRGHDLDSVLTQISDWPMNNELLVTLVRPYDPSQAQELGQSPGGGGAEMEGKADKIDAKYQMEWVIYNGFMLPVNIAPAAPPAGGEKPATAEEGKDKDKSAKAEAKRSEKTNDDPGDDNEEGTKLPF